jgi:hypothetical protein
VKILVAVPTELNQQQVEAAFDHYLAQLTEGRWVRDGRVFVEAHTSHSFDMDITDETPAEEKEVLIAVRNLRESIKELKRAKAQKKRG